MKNQYWDVVVDTCGFYPRIVRDTAQVLKGHVDHYVFVSTMSVYDYNHTLSAVDENAPLITLDDPTIENIDNEWNYGGLKVLCEKELEVLMPQQDLAEEAAKLVERD